MRIVAWVDDNIDRALRAVVREMPGVAYRRAATAPGRPRWEQLQQGEFWSQVAADEPDAVLVQVGADECGRKIKQSARSGPGAGRAAWSAGPAAVVAVLAEATARQAALAAAGFAGVLVSPFAAVEMEAVLTCAVARGKKQGRLTRRCTTLRALCRRVNRKRRHLRDKVDLLCQDLVSTNMALSETLHELRRAYVFQSQLTGEYDMQCLLHKALCLIRQEFGSSNAAVYLCSQGAIEAHVVNTVEADYGSLPEMEELLSATIVAEVRAARGPVLAADGGIWTEQAPAPTADLTGMSLLGVPVFRGGGLVAVIVLYRSDGHFSERDVKRVATFVQPLARAITAVEKLTALVG